MPAFRSLPTAVELHPTGWAEVPGTGVEITKLPLVSTTHALPDGTPLFGRLTYADALTVASQHHARLLAPGRIHDLRRPGVAVQLAPFLGTPTAETDLLHAERHDADVWRQLRALGWDGGKPVVGAGKHWIAGAPAGWSRLEGWDKDGAGPGLALWQPDAIAHRGASHYDDGTTTVLERDTAARVTPRRTALGERGSDVALWQGWLVQHGHDPGPIDGIHGAGTERASVAYAGGSGINLDAIEFIQARNYTPVKRTSVDLVVLHCTENRPPWLGVARANANRFAGPSAPRASAHYFVGPEEVVQGVREENVAWAAPGANHNGIQVEQVGQIGRQPRTDWLGDGRPVLERSARLVAAVCRRWGIPIERVDAKGLLAGQRGITTHAAVTEAFKRSSHQDPGLAGDRLWPWAEYLAIARGQF